MTVYNKAGEAREVAFRFALPDDVPQVISLLKKQHGRGYYPEMYDEGYVKDLMEREKLLVVIAELEDGTLAGIIGATKDDPCPGSITFSMLVISPSIRGFGLGKKMHAYLLQIVPIHTYTCVYGYCMTLNTVSQKNHIEFGYHLTGLLPNGYFNDTTAEYLEGLSLPVKDVLLVACLPQAKHDAGPLYAALAYRDYIIGVYTSLGVAFRLEDGEAPPPATSRYVLNNIKEHRYCELIVQKTGKDFQDILRKMLEQYGGLEHQSFTAFLNLNDPGCPRACRLLEEQGFFFTGLQPLSGPYEYLLMHYSPALPVPFDRVVVVPEFKERFDYIHHYLYQEASYGKAD